jgi:hypothetical protein
LDNRQPGEIGLSILIEELKRELLPILSIPRRYLNEQEASRYLGGLSIHTLRQWRSKGTGPDYLRVGSRIIYNVEELNNWMESHRVKGQVRP